MPHDPIRLADTRGWFLKAKEDLRGAEIDLAAVPPLLGDIVSLPAGSGESPQGISHMA